MITPNGRKCWLLYLLLAGCHADQPSKPLPSAPPPPSAAAQKTPPTPPTADSARRDAERLLEDWTAAQNSGNAAAYFALYQPAQFKGLKRTHRGKLTTYTFETWRSDRSAMFKKPFSVAVESPEIETWLTPDAHLQQGLTRVRFTQRWRSESYADHGPKTLVLWRDPRLGKPVIVFEELLISRPGWDEADAAADKRFPALSQAASVAEMIQALRAAQLTMHSAPAVAAELGDPFHRGLLLRAAAELGSLDCFTGISYEQCGSQAQDFGAVEDASLEHACVRRALLLPLLMGAPVQPEALSASSSQLLPLLDVPEDAVRDEELGKALLHACASLPEARRLPFARAALRGKDWDVAALLHGMRPQTLYALWQQTGHPAALAALPVAEHAARIVHIHVSESALPHDVLLPAVRQLNRARHRALLESLIDSADCELAMTARVQLEDAKLLPAWESATEESLALRSICLLQHDPDRPRALRELSRFFHPTHKARKVEVEDREGDTYFDEPPDSDEPSVKPPDPETQRHIDEASALIQAPEPRGVRTASIAVLEEPAPDSLFDSQAFEDATERAPDFDLIKLFESEGHYYVDYLGRYTYFWYGCPC